MSDAAKRIIRLLSGRAGFDSWWDDIDEDTKAEILAEMNKAATDQPSPREAGEGAGHGFLVDGLTDDRGDLR